MVRVVVMFVAVLYLSAATGFAQSLNELSTQPNASSGTKQAQTLDVSAKAAGLKRIAAPGGRAGVRNTLMTAKAQKAPMSRAKKVAIGVTLAVVAVVSVILISGGFGSPDEPGYQ